MTGTYRLQRTEPPTPDLRQSFSEEHPAGRLVSLDAFRGFIMIVLAAHGFGFASFSNLPREAPAWNVADYEVWQAIGQQFRHAVWITVDDRFRVAFWDLIQPAFMFMVGVAMPFSYRRRAAFGETAGARMRHAAVRAVVLVLLGVFLYSLSHRRTNWIFPNVLAQIGLGYFFVYLLHSRGRNVQIAAIAAILTGYWAFFYFQPPPENYDYEAVGARADRGEVLTGWQAPWSKNANAAFRFDQWFLPLLRTPQQADRAPATDSSDRSGADSETGLRAAIPHQRSMSWLRRWFFSNPEPWTYNRGGYTTLNFIPSMATMLLGVLCGQLLLSRERALYILFTLFVGGALCLGLGIATHLTVCPAIKRIWTPSWALYSGGCVIWMLGLFYLLFDVLPLKWFSRPLQVVGINSLAVYLMGELLHSWTADKVVRIHLTGILETLFGADALQDDHFGRIIFPCATAGVFWLLCVWMARRRLFVRI